MRERRRADLPHHRGRVQALAGVCDPPAGRRARPRCRRPRPAPLEPRLLRRRGAAGRPPACRSSSAVAGAHARAGRAGRRRSSATRWCVKAMGLLHKSDAGGVAVGIAGCRSARAASPTWRSGSRPSRSRSSGWRRLRDGVELIIGARRDPRFGPIALVGLGGVFAEVFEDVAIGLAPLDPAGAERLLELAARRGASEGRPRPAAAGHRRRPPAVAVGALAARGGPPRHRRDRDQPAAGDTHRRAGARRARDHAEEGAADAG